MTRFQFLADHQDAFEVKRMCRLLEVERSSFYRWQKTTPARAARTLAYAELADRIRQVHEADRTCGAPRITAELNDGAQPAARVNRKRVARVMREHGIVGYRRRRRVRTTVPEPADQKVADLFGRDFTAPAPNLKYVGDITYLTLACTDTETGRRKNLYPATVIDCYSRRLVGWSIADHMRTELVEDALKSATGTRGEGRSLAGAIFHSDHGSVYTSADYAALCGRLGLTQSMGAVGSSADNAMAESFNATLKREVLQDAETWPEETACRREIFAWLDRYNLRSRHSWCGYKSPTAYENAYRAAPSDPAATLPSAA